ncbi:MAG TPA: hypothetical protein PKD20_01050 [Candidatus Saccharibacteria bacterium]|nr:hypothetical protein [Candidatus Saccharibacteria bacterium]HMT55443.1 hypothetical protein [Candidatus Saccharibacteria bacterium]
MNERLITFEPEYNLRWFDTTPGFDLLYATWSDILQKKDIPVNERQNRGQLFAMNAEKALELLVGAENAVRTQYGYDRKAVQIMSRMAFQYAQFMPLDLEEEIRE